MPPFMRAVERSTALPTTAQANVTIEGNEAVFSGTTFISGQGQGDVVTRSVLNLNGVTRADMFAAAAITGFDEISAGDGTDAVIANATVLDGRGAFTKSGTGKLTLSTATGYTNATDGLRRGAPLRSGRMALPLATPSPWAPGRASLRPAA